MTKELRVYGSGGQGIITLGHMLGEAAIHDKKEVIMTEEYSPYVTGGWSRADLIISDEKVDYPMVTKLDYLITLTQEGLDNNIDSVKKDGLVFVENSMVDVSAIKSHKIIGMAAKETAESLKNVRATNIVMLGLVVGATKIVSKEAVVAAIKKRFPKYEKLNVEAFERGYKEGDAVE